jgi:soluble lytic murein transglycosylase-like protein
MFKFYKNILFLPLTNISHNYKNNNNNINKNSLWWKMKNHIIDKRKLDDLDKIFYSFIEIKDDININENIQYILEKKIPINVYNFRKIFEEKILTCKDGELKEEFLKKTLMKYLLYKGIYNPISRSLKMQFILNYLSKKNLLQLSLYKFVYGLLSNLVYENNHIPFNMLNSLHQLHKVDLEKRFIFMVENINLDGLISVGKLAKNIKISEIIERIHLLENNKIEFFYNIIELYWYLNKNYEKLETTDMANIIIHNKHLIKNSIKSCEKLKKNIINIIDKILPTLIINKYPYIEDLLDITLVKKGEEAYSILSFVNGIYGFYKKRYKDAYYYFNEALDNLNKNSNNIYEQSKYYFWIANSLLILGKQSEAIQVYKKVATFNINYYSNLSYVLLKAKPQMKSIYDLVEDSEKSPYDWYFRGLSILAEGNDFILVLSFINSINLHALKKVSKEMLKMFQLLKKLENQSFIVLLTGKIYEHTGMIFIENYPLIDPMKNFSLRKSILISSILKRETFFRTDPLISHKGARGPMQVMTATAKTLCDRNNINYCDKNLLHNISYNLKIAMKCLDELSVLFNDSLFLMIPAYNAGSPKVQQWWKILKDDLDMENFLHMFLFVELIPINVTKNYTKDVINNYILFWLINNPAPLNIKNILNFSYTE